MVIKWLDIYYESNELSFEFDQGDGVQHVTFGDVGQALIVVAIWCMGHKSSLFEIEDGPLTSEDVSTFPIRVIFNRCALLVETYRQSGVWHNRDAAYLLKLIAALAAENLPEVA